MGKLRFALLFIILAGGGLAGYHIFHGKLYTPFDSTMAPVFQLAGRATSVMSRALTKIIPVDALDEKEFGDAIALRFGNLDTKDDTRHRYVNDLMGSIARFRKKPFEYRVFVIENPAPNACAFPGGVILVTEGLLRTMSSEAELTSVLAHEMGHVELSHCLDTVRFQLLARKVGSAEIGKLADMAVNILARHTYSKTQEDEADGYAWGMMLNTAYNPSSLGGAFGKLLTYGEVPGGGGSGGSADPLREYLMTHPHMALRFQKYSERARVWWDGNPKARKYNGRNNLKKLKAFPAGFAYPGEWETREQG